MLRPFPRTVRANGRAFSSRSGVSEENITFVSHFRPNTLFAMKSILRHIPNALTCCNLACGFFAVLIFTGRAAFPLEWEWGFWLVIAAALFDFSDGMAARLLGAYSPMGKELDSLADAVSFGVAPAMAVVSMILGQGGAPAFVAVGAGVLLAVFSVLRLAKFNIDTRQSESFLGLPTPACALFFVSLPAFFDLTGATPAAWVVPALAAVFCFLLVSEIPMFSLKFKRFGWAENKLRYLFLLFGAACLLLLGKAAAVAIIPAYILFSLGQKVFCNRPAQR